MIDQNQTIDISVYGLKGHSLQISMPWDANIEDWVNTFKVILHHQTFMDDPIKELFFDEETDIRIENERPPTNCSGQSVGFFEKTYRGDYP